MSQEKAQPGSQPAKRAFLFSLRPDGSPTCHPMTALYRKGEPTFNTYGQSVKAQNLKRDPRAAAVILETWSTPPAEALCVSGRAVPIAPEEIPMSTDSAVAAKVPGGMVNLVQARLSEQKRMYFLLRQSEETR